MIRRTKLLTMGALGGLALLLAGMHGAAPTGRAAAQVATAPGAPDAGAQEAVTPEAPGLAAPDSLSPLARGLLAGRMRRHGDDMEELLRAVLLLERPRIVTLASQLASEPVLARPGDGSDTLNASLAPRFFELDALLRRQADALAQAARQREDDVALAYRFGQLAETCVSCHQAYQLPATAEPR